MKRILGLVLNMIFLLVLSLLEIGRSDEDSASEHNPLRLDFEGWHRIPAPPPPTEPYQPAPPLRIDFFNEHFMPKPPPPVEPYESAPPLRLDFLSEHVMPKPPEPIETQSLGSPLQAEFQGKGYWHNRHGLGEISAEDRNYINSLLPFSAPSSYFGTGDEPFDGYFSDDTPVEMAFIGQISEAWGAGTWRAEVSHFLVDASVGGDPRGQLAQQLLAFIFNTRHRLSGIEAVITLPDGSLAPVESMINGAVDIWVSGIPGAQSDIKDLLNGLNESNSVLYYLPVSVPA